MPYVIIDPKKQEHTANTPADVDRVLSELKKRFQPLKFKIRRIEMPVAQVA